MQWPKLNNSLSVNLTHEAISNLQIALLGLAWHSLVAFGLFILLGTRKVPGLSETQPHCRHLDCQLNWH